MKPTKSAVHFEAHEKPFDVHPVVGWVGAFAVVAAFDLLNKRTMTEGFRSTLEKPHTAAMSLLALGATAMHLVDAIPPQIDVYHQIGNLYEKLTSRE